MSSLWIPEIANLFAAIAVVAVGFVILSMEPKRFSDHPCTRAAFGMWIWQWLSFVGLYIALAAVHAAGYTQFRLWALIVVLCLLEISTVFSIGIFWILLDGDSYAMGNVKNWLVIIFVCLI